MVFSNAVFVFLFLPIFLAVYFAVPKRSWRNVVLLIFSLFFYGWGEPVYVFLMMSSVFVNYIIAVMMDKRRDRGKLLLFLGIAFNVLVIGVFKYTDFVIEIINAVFHTDIPAANVPLPIGISFFTFQILSYIIDVYRRDVAVQKNPIYLGTYIAAFPQLIAGPIVRYQTIEEELETRRENISDFASGVRRFIQGFAKKLLIANNVAFVADSILKYTPSEYGFLGGWLAIFAYTLQIYFDFSGYSDMAIGLGRMLGFHFLENFNYPYIATSITDFWRRWHISLSTFFKDYVYIPLGGNRVSKTKWIRNILIVWTLTGLWHGASWNFVLWGIYYGIILLLEKLLFLEYIKKLPKTFQHIYAMLIVIIGWAIFRVTSVSEILLLIKALFGGYGLNPAGDYIYAEVFQAKYIAALVCGAIFSMPVARLVYKKLNESTLGRGVSVAIMVVLMLLSVVNLLAGSFNPFIYFQF
ncbi:MAG: MBOAT family protein [Clostridia bacterium]|nr:MBOAT family protein [Clostridia bacterium]